MISGWLIYSREDALRNREYIKWMLEEAHHLGVHLDLVYREQLFVGIQNDDLMIRSKCVNDSRKPDFAIVRTIEPILNEQLERLGIPTFNNAHVARVCNNKALTHQFLAGKGIPMLDTLFLHVANLSFVPFPYPFIVKLVSGRGGKDVNLIRSDTDLEHFMLTHPDADVIVQKVGPVVGKDVRVFVVGTDIIASVLRFSHSDFRANFSLGGNVERFQLDGEQVSLVHKVIEQFNFGLVGVDFLFDADGGLILNEIEDVVGSRTLSYLNTGINLVRIYLEHILRTIS